MSHYTMHTSTVTRHNFDVAMMADGTLAAEEVSDAIGAAWQRRNAFTEDLYDGTHIGTSVTTVRVTIVDDTHIRVYFEIEERK